MKTIIQDVLHAFFMGFVVPTILLTGTVRCTDAKDLRDPPPAEPTAGRPGLSVTIMTTGEDTRQLELNDYLTGVLLAEMPAAFEPEALKAQAVAARTYTCKAIETGGKHGSGILCTNSSCCQAYLLPQDYLAQGGTEAGLSKIRTAVADTDNFVLTYDNQLIEATYFSCSGGTTEDAVAVWGNEYPYLISVDSPGEEESVRYWNTVTYTPEAFQEALGLTLSGEPETWFGLTSYTRGNGVDVMMIGGNRFSGTQLRSLLKLNSTAFSVEVTDHLIRITTRGYGHRVGMSQYGAEAMALNGSSYTEILAHYYPGTSIENAVK